MYDAPIEDAKRLRSFGPVQQRLKVRDQFAQNTLARRRAAAAPPSAQTCSSLVVPPTMPCWLLAVMPVPGASIPRPSNF